MQSNHSSKAGLVSGDDWSCQMLSDARPVALAYACGMSDAQGSETGPAVDPKISRKDVASWLSGPRETLESQGMDFGYRGQRLGLPESGVGSVASLSRRAAGIAIDWLAAILVGRLIAPQVLYGSSESSLITMGVFFVSVLVLTSLAGASFGQRLMGMRVESLQGGAVMPARVLVRTLLICLVVPAVITDRDGRGLHDKAANSVVVRTRS